MKITKDHFFWVPFSHLEYFLSIRSPFMSFHQPLINFSKYEPFLHKFLMTSKKIF